MWKSFWIVLVQFQSVVLSEIDELSCFNKNYEYLSCQWPTSLNSTCWAMTYSDDGKTQNVCNIIRTGKTLSCNVDRFYEDSNYVFILTRLCGDTASCTRIVPANDSYVKLNPVSHPSARWTSKTKANLTWTMPQSCLSLYDANEGFVCQVSLYKNLSEISQTVCNVKCNPTTYSVRVQSLLLQNLTAFSNYTVNIRCKTRTSLFWSPPSSCSFIPTVSVPYESPTLDKGSFFIFNCSVKNVCMIIYWKMMFHEDEEILGYNVELRQNHNITMHWNGSQMSALFEHVTTDPKQISVLAWNGAGVSTSKTVLMNYNDTYRPSNVVIRKFNKNVYEVRWDSNNSTSLRKTLDAVFGIYWCFGERNLKYTIKPVFCPRGISWIHINTDEVKYYPPSSFRYNVTTTSGEGLNLAIAILHGGYSSGLVWSSSETVTNKKKDSPATLWIPVGIALGLGIPMSVICVIFISRLLMKHCRPYPIDPPEVESKNTEQLQSI